MEKNTLVIACFACTTADCNLQVEYANTFKTWHHPLCILTMFYRLCTLKYELIQQVMIKMFVKSAAYLKTGVFHL